MPSLQSSNWCFTINNYTDADNDQLSRLEYKYIVFGKEVGTDLTPHYQGYVELKKRSSLKAVKVLLTRAHWEPRKGTALQAADYCKKEGDFYEDGKISSERQLAGGDAEVERWDLALCAVQEGRLEDIPGDIIGRNLKSLEYAARRIKMNAMDLSDTEDKMLWYYGPSGTGKSRYARENNPGFYLKMCNKWWDDYSGEEVVIIEDFDKKHDVLVHHMKIWADRYKFPAEIKGGKIDIRPRLIIVTSNYSPKDIWQEASDLEPMLRRFKVVHFPNVLKLTK